MVGGSGKSSIKDDPIRDYLPPKHPPRNPQPDLVGFEHSPADCTPRLIHRFFQREAKVRVQWWVIITEDNRTNIG